MLCGLCWDWGLLEVSRSQDGSGNKVWLLEPGAGGMGLWPSTDRNVNFLDIFLLILTNPLEMSTEGD